MARRPKNENTHGQSPQGRRYLEVLDIHENISPLPVYRALFPPRSGSIRPRLDDFATVTLKHPQTLESSRCVPGRAQHIELGSFLRSENQ